MDDRVPGFRGTTTGPTRRGADIHADPGARPPLFGATRGLNVTVGISDGMMHVVAEIPGMNASDIAVSVAKDCLTLRGVHCMFGAFSQAVQLPEMARGDHKRIAAERAQLRIDLPLETEDGEAVR